MTREPIEVTRQDRIFCLKASSGYHSEVCEECKFYPDCDHMTQSDMTELTIKDLETLEQEPKTGHWIDGHCSECGCDVPAYIVDWKWQKDMDAKYCPNCGAKME